MRGILLLVVACLVGVLAAAATGKGRLASTTVVVHLGPHVFGHTRAGERVVARRWGTGRGAIGQWQDQGGPIEGGASFDVDRAGDVFVLDGVNGRILAFRPNGRLQTAIPLDAGSKQHLQAGDVFDHVNSDLAVGDDGTFYVLEPHDILHRRWQKLWSFTRRGGRPLATALTAGDTVRIDGATAIVSQPGSGCGPTCPRTPQHWRPLMHDGRPAKAGWVPYRTFDDGSRLEIRLDVPHGFIGLVLTRPDGTRTSWVVRSAPAFGALEGLELAGRYVVIALLVSNGSASEYDVAVLGAHGLAERFSVPFDEYSDPSYDGEFRTRGSSLYHLGTTGAGLYVDRYDLAR